MSLMLLDLFCPYLRWSHLHNVVVMINRLKSMTMKAEEVMLVEMDLSFYWMINGDDHLNRSMSFDQNSFLHQHVSCWREHVLFEENGQFKDFCICFDLIASLVLFFSLFLCLVFFNAFFITVVQRHCQNRNIDDSFFFFNLVAVVAFVFSLFFSFFSPSLLSNTRSLTISDYRIFFLVFLQVSFTLRKMRSEGQQNWWPIPIISQ